ncbi:MAG: DUF2953 domain-containing protein [Bacillota bacterium]
MRVKRLFKWVVIGFALFLFILLLVNIRVIVEVRVGVKNSGLHIEVILVRRLLRREFTLEQLITGFDRGEPAVGWKQTEEAGRGKRLAEGWRSMTSPEIRRQFRQALTLRREIKRRRWLSRMMRSAINTKNLNWRTVVGLDDAMYTAMTAGVLWSFKGWVLVLVSCLSRLHNRQIEVVPYFGGRKVECTFHCEILFRLASLLVIMPVMYILFRRTSSIGASRGLREGSAV